MSFSTEFDREISDSKEIGELLQMAFLHGWKFSCMQLVRNHLTSDDVTVLDVNVHDREFIVDSDVLVASSERTRVVAFRAQSGGLSLIFKATLEGTSKDPSACECKFRFPQFLRFSQLRKAVRINMLDQPAIPVTLYADRGEQFQGRVIDLSATGAKIQILGDVSSKLEPMQLIEDCQLILPNNRTVDLKAQVRGNFFDTSSGVSYLRCEFVEMGETDESELQKLISAALMHGGATDISMAS
ncbi:MAG: PilZ domain-containing protein [Proteobacteria bacterium]|jgi:c-di-GMP-binding flagellar brake protein YcgR|nr:PilZ domain-containing protein [Pseudomonadota bacterium]MDA0927582.1 PilZ domain-containing protein [Pseudomonadota bacterium]